MSFIIDVSHGSNFLPHGTSLVVQVCDAMIHVTKVVGVLVICQLDSCEIQEQYALWLAVFLALTTIDQVINMHEMKAAYFSCL